MGTCLNLKILTMHLKRLVERRDLWSIGIYKLESRKDLLRLDAHDPFHLIGEKGFRKGLDYQSDGSGPILV